MTGARFGPHPIFVLAPVGRDGEVIAGILRDAGLPARLVSAFGGDDGPRYEDGAGLIVTEEAFERLDPTPLYDWLQGQPPWSDYPIVLLRLRDAPVTPRTTTFIESLGKVTILERPLHPITVVAAARSALRARHRQWEAEAFLVERVRAAETLRESEARFRAVSDSAPVLIWMSDARAGFLYANRRHEEMFGQPAESFLGQAWRRVLHPDDADRVADEFLRAAVENIELRTEFRVLDAQGHVRWLRCEATPRSREEPIGHVGSGVDVTDTRLAADQLERLVEARTAELAAANRRLVAEMAEREAMETKLRHAQRLEAVGQLTAGVAHDFNNLLTVVLGGIGFLERTAGASERRRLEMMRVAAERGAKLTAQLLAFSRRQKLEPKPVNLNEAVQGLRDLLQSTIGGGHRLEIELAPELWPALVDPTQIEMVILNLAINARDAMEVGGSLTVQTANVVLDAARERPEEPEPGEYVMVCVRDTGSGIPPQVLERVFDPFFTTKPVGRGSGLGLSQVLGFAVQSGGGVKIETEVGKGTAVQVFLPRARAAATAAPRPSLLADGLLASRKGGVVLLVDDDEMVRESTVQMLQQLGFKVLEAGSGAAALEIIESRTRLDLMLVDFAMPGMNGAEVARAVAARRPGLPVLFVTGYADLSSLSEVDEARILPKPFDAEELARRLSSALAATPA
ncbi:response regulator [Phenylobacterium terrae]|uniref:histidine kinase n=1 Tax=Phenylobacterium terrae TaxID=2665495 RepID=A0ABW4N550_9CAUL